MLKFFRNLFKTKLGLALVLGFLVLIALAFASADVSRTGTFGGVAGGDRVAKVGDEKIGTADLIRSVNQNLDRTRQQDPTLTMQAFLANKGLEASLDSLIDRFAIKAFADKYGIRAGTNLVNSEIRRIPAFRGPDGNFSDDVYRQVLAQQRISDAQAREDLGTGLLSQQLFLPAGYGAAIPGKLAYRYAQLFKERRKGSIAVIPAVAFAPPAGVDEKTLQTYYNSHKDLFVIPERRVIRYATFDDKALGDTINPTDAEIAARYKQNAANYAAKETRTFTQLIVPTEAAAKSIHDRIAAGASIEAVAKEAGLRTAPLTDVTKEDITSQASSAVAQTFFSTPTGKVTAPARSTIGWHVARVDAVKSVPARSLEQVRGEIADSLRTEKRANGLAELASKIEDELNSGATLPEIAKDLKLDVQTTKPALADGRIYGANETLPQELAPAVKSLFQMDEEQAQVAPVLGGQAYMVYDVASITPAAAPPFAEIKQAVEAEWRQSEGLKLAQAAADRILERVRKGQALGAAMAAEKVKLPPADPVDLTRQQLVAQQNKRIPPPLALMFSMAQGTVKKLEAPQKAGFFVVDLNSITMDDLPKDDPLIAQAKSQMGEILSNEYADQLRIAMRQEMGVERNPDAIAAVRKQLAGQN